MSVDIGSTELDADGRVRHDGAPYTGEVVEAAPNGQVISSTSYLKGLADGPTREWFPDGRLRAEGRSRYGVGAVGVWREWHHNGRLAAEHGFSDNGRLQFVRRWNDAGSPIEDVTY